jgi:uncharacterized repeat protein (TIGR03803 family)
MAALPAAGADILYRFTGGPDGGGPFGGLVSDGEGNLYGTTEAGGLAGCTSPLDVPGCGVVFRLSPPEGGHGAWQETVLYTFAGGADGNGPVASLVRDNNGNLFGTTEEGGIVTSGCSAGCGTVFEISPPAGGSGSWTETVLYRFGINASDGASPTGDLVMDAQGNLFGTTPDGGANGLGTVFELSPQGGWSELKLHDFAPADGWLPVAGLLLGSGGTLFGVTEVGINDKPVCIKQHDCGTIFSLSPPSGGGDWTFSVLFQFPGKGQDGIYPVAKLVEDDKGRLLGTTSTYGISQGTQDLGTVFRLVPPSQSRTKWKLETLDAFATVGANPEGPVLLGRHGVLYGTTAKSGIGLSGNGLVYALSPPASPGGSWQQTQLFSFAKPGDGAVPMAGLISDAKGLLYGTASQGGGTCATQYCGTVFRVNPR